LASAGGAAEEKAATQSSAGSANGGADALTREGNTLAKKGRWAEAEARFREAWGRKQSYDIGGNLGLAELALGRYVAAAEHLSFALKRFPVSGKPEHKELLQEALTQARAHVGTLRIEVSARGARVLVDGRDVGSSPLLEEVFVEPGSRRIEARLATYDGATQQVEVSGGASRRVSLSLTSAKAPRGGAQDKASGLSPVAQDKASGLSPVVIGGLCATGAALGAGALFAVLSNAKASDADAQMDALAQQGGPNACAGASAHAGCAALHATREQQYTFGNVALWSFVGAGALGAGTLIYSLVAPGRHARAKATGMRAAPVATPRGGGMVLSGSF